EEDHRLAALQALIDETPRKRRVGWLLVEHAVVVEQRRDGFHVFDGRAANGRIHAASVSLASSSAWCSRVRRSTSSSRLPCRMLGKSYRVRPSTRWSVMRPCGKL